MGNRCGKNSKYLDPEKKYQKIRSDSRRLSLLAEDGKCGSSTRFLRAYTKTPGFYLRKSRKFSSMKKNDKEELDGLFTRKKNRTEQWILGWQNLVRCCLSNPNMSPCTMCSKTGSALSCKTCSSAAYCSTTCQLKDANNDHHKCLPYSILYEERCGRMLMATRDISAGEILFTDTKGAIGPRPEDNPKPICLSCYKTLPPIVYRCRFCSLPLCSTFCQRDDSPHARECQLLRIHGPK